MDNKASTSVKELSPELKQIYERVMNTEINSRPNTPNNSLQKTETAQEATAEKKLEPVAPEHASPDALSSVSPRPLTKNSESFVFKSHESSHATQEHTIAQAHTATGKNVSPKLILFGVIMFLIIYLLVWLKVFGFV